MTPENVALFERERRGPLTSGFSEGGAFIRTRPDLDADPTRPSRSSTSQAHRTPCSTHVTDCSKPALVELFKAPDSLAGTSKNPRGEVAFAMTGANSLLPDHVQLSLDGVYASPNTLTSTLSPIGSGPAQGFQQQVNFVAYKFVFDPRQRPLITVTFHAKWTSPRSPGSCWLNVPNVLGRTAEDAPSEANQALGPINFVTGLSYPISKALLLVSTNHAKTAPQVDPAGSLPAPTSLFPAAWSCDSATVQGTGCQVAALLATAGADAIRTRDLTLWSIASGLLLAVFVEALVGLARDFAVDRRASRPTSKR